MILNLNDHRRPNYSRSSSCIDLMQKPIEIYFFLDPLCSKCWSLDPYLKKLSIEYGRFFTIRPIICNHLNVVQLENSPYKNYDDFVTNNKSYEIDFQQCKENQTQCPSISMAIKAAELQGKNAGRIYLRKIQENFFLLKKNVTDITILIKCALESNLDIEEFINDLNSDSAKRASQCDIKITKEMNVKKSPTIVFFNHMNEDDGIKISGLNSYDIYVMILTEMLERNPIPSRKPAILDYLSFYKTVSQKEISIVFDLTTEEVEREMIKLQLSRKAKREERKNEIFWKYIQKSKSN